jgi:hemerythrin-like domain-containing protein
MAHITRREFLSRVGGATGFMGVAGSGGTLFFEAPRKETEEIEISPVEDLMREHGLLRRILLIYQEWIDRLGANKVEQIDTLSESAKIIRSFVENYHEKLEEEYLFPIFKKAKKKVDLVDALLQQHRAGRRLTEETLKLSSVESLKNPDNQKKLSGLLNDFIRMYGPHAAREDTVLFPAFNDLVTTKEYEKMGDIFETREKQLFGERGFERMIDQVAIIERKLMIYDLSRFTPKL